MELDEHGREVRRRQPPGYREPELDEDAWPDAEHSPHTFEGRMEVVGNLSRGLVRQRRSPSVRIAGYLVVVAMLVPIVLGTFSILIRALTD